MAGILNLRRWRRAIAWLAGVALFAVLVPIGAAGAAGPAFASDDFNRTTLGTSWTVVNPVGDGTVSMTGAGTGDARLLLSVPAGVDHNPWNASNRSLRVMQTSANTDFIAELRFESIPTLKYQEQGLLVQQDGSNWLRFEVQFNGTSLRAYTASTTADVSTKRLDKPAVAGTASYLRVARAGDTWTLSTSGDGTNWNTAGSFVQALSVSSVGPFVGSSGAPAPGFTADLDYIFETSSPVVPEDGVVTPGPYTLSTTTAGSGSIARSPDKTSYGNGETVTLTATPGAGATFTGWSGDATGGANPIVVTMNADKLVLASFTNNADPPVISSVAAAPGSSSAVVTWATNAPSSSSVSVGTNTSYTLGTFGSATLVTSHSVTIPGLAPSTTYHYQVSSTDGGGLSSTTNDATFTTSAAPAFAFVSDDFNRTSLAPMPWSVVNPRNDGSVSLTGAGTPDAWLQLSVPGGTAHDAWGTNNSLRVMQPAANQDFAAEAKFDSVPAQKYQTQGLLVQQDANNWLRFNIHYDGSSLRAYAAKTVNGASTQIVNAKQATGTKFWIRVERTGNTWVMRTSVNGSAWAQVTSFTYGLNVTSIGPFAANSGSPVPAFTALVDYVFEANSPIAPEDTPAFIVQRALTTSVSGQGTITRSPNQSTYDNGTIVTLTANPAPGWSFAGWSGAVAGGQNPAQITMDADKSVTATFVTDTTPPVISNVSVTPSTTSAVVTWFTNEPATSSVAVGTTTAYSLGSFGSSTLSTSHSVNLPGLQANTAYHYLVSSTDGVGLASSTDDGTFTTSSQSGPTVAIWYGDSQTAGQAGAGQTRFNVLGNVSDADGVAALSYTINGSASRSLTVGPNNRRLQNPGDFNADIPFTDLVNGSNLVRITTRDAPGNITTKDVQVQRVISTPSLPYTTNWGSAGTIGTQAQVVDGKWAIDGNTIRPMELGYDRVVAIGDVSWHDYEVSVPVTPHTIGPHAGDPLSGTALFGFGLNWQGHTQKGNEQPGYWWYPTGAFTWYRFFASTPKLQLHGNDDSPSVSASNVPVSFNQTYMLKARSDTVSGGVQYSVKLWPQGSSEPSAWNLTILEPAGPATGSIVLIAHQLDVQIRKRNRDVHSLTSRAVTMSDRNQGDGKSHGRKRSDESSAAGAG